MEEYLVSMMTTFDIDLIEEYVARHCVRLAEFFGADEIAEGARQHPALRSSQ
jgi:truncated hemoglobin YjbI